MVSLKKFLEDNGIDCWFDLDDMSGSTLDAMATAVEGACAVIVCLSPEYKESAACRSEGEYAFNLKKPIVPVKVDINYSPDGWLGMLLGSKLYFDVSSDQAFASNCQSILKEVLKHYGGNGGPQPGGHGKTGCSPLLCVSVCLCVCVCASLSTSLDLSVLGAIRTHTHTHLASQPVKMPSASSSSKITPQSSSSNVASTGGSSNGGGGGLSGDALKTVLDSFLSNLETMRENITKRVDECFDALDSRVRDLEKKVFKK